MDRQYHVRQLGQTEYTEVHALQRRLQAGRAGGTVPDQLLLTEHRPVFTLGKSHPSPDLRVAPEAIAALGIPIVPTERGGDITYHGPGQLVVYGIIDLRGWGIGAVDWVDGLEATVVKVLADFGVRGDRVPGARGAWVNGRKMASVGINVRRSVTMHGIALNVAPNLEHFGLINPCGMADIEMTSLAAETGHEISIEEAGERFLRHFDAVFGARSLPQLASTSV